MGQTKEMMKNVEKMCQWVTIGMRIASDPSLMKELEGKNVLELLSINKSNTKNNTNKKKHRKNGYAVQDEELLYKLADAGLLCKLHGVKSDIEPRIYYFDEDYDVKLIVEDFNKSNDMKVDCSDTESTKNESDLVAESIEKETTN